MYKLFIIEDDEKIALSVKKHVETFGCTAVVCDDFYKVTERFKQESPHLVLLDISLPYAGGFHWCRELRRISSVPIIFISSASDNMSIIMAMNQGADDFIAKPFDLNVLTAKIQALLRRTYDLTTPINVLEHRGATLNLGDATLSYNGERIELTKNEFKILHTLIEKKGEIVSRDTLMEHLWATDSFVDENTLTVNMTRLRRKLEGIDLCDFILTKKGLGYIIQ